MPSALTPELALAYVRELHPGLADAAIGAPGKPLERRDDAVRVRSGNWEIAVVPGRETLPGLLVHDCEMTLRVEKA